jgi:hypothetical protein
VEENNIPKAKGHREEGYRLRQRVPEHNPNQGLDPVLRNVTQAIFIAPENVSLKRKARYRSDS